MFRDLFKDTIAAKNISAFLNVFVFFFSDAVPTLPSALDNRGATELLFRGSDICKVLKCIQSNVYTFKHFVLISVSS